MRYRDHRGSLSESMKTVIEVDSVDEIKARLNKYYNDFGQSVEEIKFEYCCFDARIGWDTYYVMQKLNGENSFTVAGMSDGKL